MKKLIALLSAAILAVSPVMNIEAIDTPETDALPADAAVSAPLGESDVPADTTEDDTVSPAEVIPGEADDSAEDTGTDAPAEHVHVWEWQPDDDNYHSLKCTICGENQGSKGSHQYTFYDYSDFVFSDIIGLPADEGLAILRERFGEEALHLTESQAEDGATEYYLRVPLRGNICSQCGYIPANAYYSGNYITIKNGIIEKIRASISLDDLMGSVLYRDYSPKYTVSLPTSITYSDLLMYREAGIAVINGEEFKVEYKETPSEGYPEGRVSYQFFFITDKYTANYNASNYNFVYDFDTGEFVWKIMEPDPGLNIELNNIFATQKDEHEHNWEWQSDNSSEHSKKCTICGEVLESGQHEYEENDYSDFVFSDIIGMPAEEGLAILRERFGEDALQLSDVEYTDGSIAYYLKLLVHGGVCLKCGYVPPSYFSDSLKYSSHIIFVKDGTITQISEYNTDAASIAGWSYPDKCPQYSRSLPFCISYADLVKYRDMKWVVLNGEEFWVEYKEADSQILEGAIAYQFYFVNDNYKVLYNTGNWGYDPSTGSLQLREPSDSTLIGISSILPSQKHEHNWECTYDDKYKHSMKCTICGKEDSEDHQYELHDYSDFLFSNIIGLPAEEGLEILRERFGEDALQLSDVQYTDGSFTYYLSLVVRGDTCIKCGYSINSTVHSGNFITVKDGIIDQIGLYGSDPSYSAIWLYPDKCPQFSKAIPLSFAYSDLVKYRDMGRFVINDEEFTVEYNEVDLPEELEGAKICQFYFVNDDYTVLYQVANYGYYGIDSTGQPTLQLIEFNDDDLIGVSYMSPSQKYTPADVDGNGSVTLDDALLTLKCAMDIDLGDETFNKQAADVTGDGNITVDDAIAVLKIAMNVKQ